MKNKKANIVAVLASLLFVGCSTTKYIPEGDQLYVGLDKIKYVAQQRDDHFMATRDELEAALACAPNGALLGSSYYRTPFPYSLWIWNAFSTSASPLGKWVAKSFGKRPVLMSWVNPALRASVGQLVLQSHGYFRGTVQYETLTQSNPKQAKIGYQINFGPLFTLDSISYENFPASADSLLAQLARRGKSSVAMLLMQVHSRPNARALAIFFATMATTIINRAMPLIWPTHCVFQRKCS